MTEDDIKAMFVVAFNQLATEKKEILDNIGVVRKTLTDTAELAAEKERLQEEMGVLVEMTQSCVAENARVAQNQEEYQKRYDGLVERYENAKARFDEVTYAISQKEAQGERLDRFAAALREQEGVLAAFDESLWGSLVDFVTVGREKKTVTFKDGTEIEVK